MLGGARQRALFAMADSLGALAGARAMVGLGVSACLMAALKGFALWYPPERQSSMIGFIMASGSLGALTASVPLEAVLPVLGWRGAFWIIAAVCLLAAVLALRAARLALQWRRGLARCSLARGRGHLRRAQPSCAMPRPRCSSSAASLALQACGWCPGS